MARRKVTPTQPVKHRWFTEASPSDPIYTRGYAIGVKRFSKSSPATVETSSPNEEAKKPLQGR